MYCRCKDCKKMKRKGKILGSRKMGFWLVDQFTGTTYYYYGSVSDYVNFPKFMKGKRPSRRTRRNNLTAQ
jgi:hypothetical protein